MDTNNIAPGTSLRKRRRSQKPLGGIDARQRFTSERPCPVCSGYDQAPRGQGIR